MSDKLTPVLVTTTNRGVYFGLVDREAYDALSVNERASIDLQQMRHVYYWAPHGGAQDGLSALCTVGPAKGSKVGPRVPRMTVRNVQNVADVSDDALAAWERVSWR